MSQLSILDYFANTNSGYIHARGRIATSKLIHLLDCQDNNTILEIGCGTGATLAKLASLHKKTMFYGIDVSDKMLRASSKRLQFSLVTQNTQLLQVDKTKPLPFEDNFFDNIYAESILAIQEENELEKLLQEIARVLKPKGKLVFNETIWLETTTSAKAAEINNSCKAAFGIIQSNAKYPHVAHWKGLLKQIGFEIRLQIPVSTIQNKKGLKSNNLHSFLSEVYTLKGKIKSIFIPSLKKEKNNYRQKMNLIIDTKKQLMEGVIFLAEKAK